MPFFFLAWLMISNISVEAASRWSLPSSTPQPTTDQQSIYLYTAPFWDKHRYDGGRAISCFIPLSYAKQHRVWLDTGIIAKGFTAGYRYVLKESYANQYWFGGVYFAPDVYLTLPKSQKTLIRTNVGLEVGGSNIGFLTLNVYYVHPLINQSKEAYNQLLLQEQSVEIIDDLGGTLKWSSIAHRSGLRGSIIFGCSQVQNRCLTVFNPEKIWRLGLGIQLAVQKKAHIDIQYIVIDRYQKGWKFGIQLTEVDTFNADSMFQDRLNRPPERHIPCYQSVIHAEVDRVNEGQSDREETVVGSPTSEQAPPLKPSYFPPTVEEKTATPSTQQWGEHLLDQEKKFTFVPQPPSDSVQITSSSKHTKETVHARQPTKSSTRAGLSISSLTDNQASEINPLKDPKNLRKKKPKTSAAVDPGNKQSSEQIAVPAKTNTSDARGAYLISSVNNPNLKEEFNRLPVSQSGKTVKEELKKPQITDNQEKTKNSSVKQKEQTFVMPKRASTTYSTFNPKHAREELPRAVKRASTVPVNSGQEQLNVPSSTPKKDDLAEQEKELRRLEQEIKSKREAADKAAEKVGNLKCTATTGFQSSSVNDASGFSKQKDSKSFSSSDTTQTFNTGNAYQLPTENLPYRSQKDSSSRSQRNTYSDRPRLYLSNFFDIEYAWDSYNHGRMIQYGLTKSQTSEEIYVRRICSFPMLNNSGSLRYQVSRSFNQDDMDVLNFNFHNLSTIFFEDCGDRIAQFIKCIDINKKEFDQAICYFSKKCIAKEPSKLFGASAFNIFNHSNLNSEYSRRVHMPTFERIYYADENSIYFGRNAQYGIYYDPENKTHYQKAIFTFPNAEQYAAKFGVFPPPLPVSGKFFENMPLYQLYDFKQSYWKEDPENKDWMIQYLNCIDYNRRIFEQPVCRAPRQYAKVLPKTVPYFNSSSNQESSNTNQTNRENNSYHPVEDAKKKFESLSGMEIELTNLDNLNSMFRKASLKLHPDKKPEKERDEFLKKFQELQGAYDILKDYKDKQD